MRLRQPIKTVKGWEANMLSEQERENKCQHIELHFSSGDYYIFCDVCGSKWVRHGNNRPEYGHDKDGNPIGAMPEAANIGFHDENQIRSRSVAPLAPQAEGEIERQIKIHYATYDTNPETASEFPHGPIIEVDGSFIYFDLYQEKLAEEVYAALRSAQAPARTYADGIEDAAKCAEQRGGWSLPKWYDGPIIAAAIRALATKPAAVNG